MFTTLTPAYGRDYKKASDVCNDFKEGKDFILRDITSPWDMKPCNVNSFSADEILNTTFNIRYYKLTRIAVIRITKDGITLNGKLVDKNSK